MAITGTIVVTWQSIIEPGHTNPVRRCDIFWTADASGNVNGFVGYNGALARWTFVPGASPLTVPTDAYDLVLNDVSAIDVFQGTGSNLSATNTTEWAKWMTGTDGTNNSAVPRLVCDSLNLVISNAGPGGQGAIHIYGR